MDNMAAASVVISPPLISRPLLVDFEPQSASESGCHGEAAAPSFAINSNTLI